MVSGLAFQSAAQVTPKTDTVSDKAPVKVEKPPKKEIKEESGKKEKEQKITEAGEIINDASDKKNSNPEKEKEENSIKRFSEGTPSFITDSLDSYIERGMKLWQIPGLAITIVKDGKVIFMKGYGVREIGKTEKIDANTLFIIASNSKLFTGTSLAKLEEEKKLSLNDRITKFIPWFRLYDSNSTRLVTVRDMLSHRIGTKTFQGDFTFWDSNLKKDSIIWKMRWLKPVGEFRQDYGYCNSCFLVAGQVLEKVTGQSWETYVQENILSPLAMNNTYMNTADLAKRNNVAQPHNNLYSSLTKIPFDNVDNLGPATSMVSNVNDLSHWLIMQLDSGRYEGKQILPWEVIQKTRDGNILTGSRKSAAYPTHFRAYGLGLYMTDYSGKQVYWHTGGAFGHVTNVCFVPEEKLGISILTNNDNQSFFEALRYQILDAYFKQNYVDRSLYLYNFFQPGKKRMDTDLDALKQRVDKKNQPAIKLEDYTGYYYNTVYGKVTISKNGNLLICHFQHHPDLVGYMEYMDNNEFRMTYSNIGYGIHPVTFGFSNGKPSSVIIRVNEFVEYDSYLFIKDPKGMMVK
jgi:CubicO group peptidase (beta-lactamase class C family)